MTVAELITELHKLPADLPVVVDVDGITWDAERARVVQALITRVPNAGDNDIETDAVEII